MLNFWRVAAICSVICATTGTLLSIFLEGNTLNWAALWVATATWTRVEWVLAALTESKKDDREDDED